MLKKTKLISVFKKQSKKFYFFLIILSLINSVLNSLLIIIINETIANQGIKYVHNLDWLVFIGVISLSFFVSQLFQKNTIRFSNKVVCDFEIQIFANLKNASYQSFSSLGNERVYTGIGDAKTLSQIPTFLIGFINSLSIIICGLIYMFVISPFASLMIIGIIIGLLIFYMIRNKLIEKDLNKLRDLQDDFHRYIKDFLFGFKELKMSHSRIDSLYHGFLVKALHNVRDLGTKTSIKYMNNELTANYGWYIIIGFVIFGLPMLFDFDQSKTITLLLIIMFLVGPISGLIGSIPFYTRVKIAMERLYDLEKDIDRKIDQRTITERISSTTSDFEDLVFENVVYEYEDKRTSENFILGPINLKICSGEVLFIVGGNGSGKSTFMNLLTGLFMPQEGKIFYNGICLTEDNIQDYSNKIAVVFFNPYLFEENYDSYELNEDNERLMNMISMMKMQNILKFKTEENKIDLNLSQGQTKRLAFIYSLMENKTILAYDEWAAEQDPVFRHYFYTEILNQLRNSNKTIIMISHDDRFYPCADRVIKFNYGKIVKDYRNEVSNSAQLNTV